MAYKSNDLGMRIGAAGNQAATVVAAAVGNGSIPITEAEDFYADLMKSFSKKMDELQVELGGKTAAESDGEQLLRSELGGSDSGKFEVRILGKQHGPKPDWLDAACEAAGVPAVFDNRVDKNGNDITGTNKPWFRSPRDAKQGPSDKPFWPPKN